MAGTRYRPPNPDGPATPYITRTGYERLKKEYEALWSGRRPEVVRALSAAAAEGDRSENAEYIYRKKELREIDARVRYLQVRLPSLKVVDIAPPDPKRVFFGALVTVADVQSDAETLHHIVGPDEVLSVPHGISIDSPLARALMKKTEGDEVRVQLPGREAVFEIVCVTYGA